MALLLAAQGISDGRAPTRRWSRHGSRSQRAGERVMASVIRYLETKLKLNRDKRGVDLAAKGKFLGLRVHRPWQEGAVEHRAGEPHAAQAGSSQDNQAQSRRVSTTGADRTGALHGWLGGVLPPSQDPLGVPGIRPVAQAAAVVLAVETLEVAADACHRTTGCEDRAVLGLGDGLWEPRAVACGWQPCHDSGALECRLRRSRIPKPKPTEEIPGTSHFLNRRMRAPHDR